MYTIIGKKGQTAGKSPEVIAVQTVDYCHPSPYRRPIGIIPLAHSVAMALTGQNAHDKYLGCLQKKRWHREEREGHADAEIFADTAGWGHLIDPTQAYHARAADLYRSARQQGHKLITSNYILSELVALLTSPLRIPRQRLVASSKG